LVSAAQALLVARLYEPSRAFTCNARNVSQCLELRKEHHLGLALLTRSVDSRSKSNKLRSGQRVGRKFSDLQASLQKLLDKIKSRYGKANSAEGAALRRVRQIRVHADPSGDAPSVEVLLTFILEPSELQRSDDVVPASPGLAAWLDAKTRPAADLAAFPGKQ